jgi:hypothetical protein
LHFLLHMFGPDAKAKEQRRQLPHQRPAQEAREGEGAIGVEGGFEQAVLHESDDSLDDARGPFAPTLHSVKISHRHLSCLKWGPEDVCSGDGVHDGIVNAIAPGWGHHMSSITQQEQAWADISTARRLLC